MAIETELGHEKAMAEVRPFAHLRVTPEERARLLAMAPPPFDVEAWQRDAVPPTTEELADLEEFLRELEEMRQYDLERQQQRLVDRCE
jgi:hypothetical protein